MNKEDRNNTAMRFQIRDEDLLQTIHYYDGVVARRHLKYLFWRDKSWRAMERRLSLLKANGYINWPSLEQRKIHPIPEPVIWLGWKGAMVLTGKAGIGTNPPLKVNEYHLRIFERALRERGFHWLREPRWIQLKHDLTVTDLRFWVAASLREMGIMELGEWTNESMFRIRTDYVEYEIKSSKDNVWIKKRRGVCPDGFFTVVDKERKEKNLSHTARFLLEVDMATHDNLSFGIEKAAAGAAYVRSRQFRERFGSNVANWLLVTTGKTRMKNLMKEVKDRVPESARMFYFTTMDHMPKHNFFLDPIWRKADGHDQVSLIAR